MDNIQFKKIGEYHVFNRWYNLIDGLTKWFFFLKKKGENIVEFQERDKIKSCSLL